jgi:probable phosphoglycerate mutase
MTRQTITRLIAIRHGETEWNSAVRFQGHLDSVLSKAGLAQARALGARLARERFDILLSSDLGRTLQTASAVATHTGHEIVVEPLLRERHMGIFQGLTADEAEARYPQEFSRFKSRDPDFAIPGGESASQLYRRAVDSFTGLALRYPGQTLATVTHGGILAMLYRHAKNMPLEAPRDFSIHNTGINRFHFTAGAWELQIWGDVGHLRESGLDDLD